MGKSISIVGTKITLKGLTYIPQVDGKMIVLDMATPTKRSGYIRTDTEKWTTNETARFIFVPVLGLRGTTLKIDAKSGQNLRIAFLKKPYFSNGSTPDFCQGTSLITRDAPVESFTEVIPSDCAYLYVFTTDIYGVDVTPTINDIIVPTTYTITISGDEIVNNGETWQMEIGDSFVLNEIEANAGYGINLVTIIMGNTDITQEAYQDGVISIDRVTGNVVITVETASVTDATMFTKRETGNGISILNNKALLKGVRGNSSIWLQKVAKVDFIDNTRTGWDSLRGTLSASEGVMHVVHPSTSNTLIYLSTVVFTEAHRYLCVMKVKQLNGTSKANVRFGDWNSDIYGSYINLSDGWYIYYAVKTYSTAPTGNGRRFCIGSAAGIDFDVEWVNCIDLTRLGNGITSYSTFAKLFPNMPYAYTASQILLNNSMTNYISKDGNEETLQNVSLNVPTLTGKLNGEGESVVVFPNGLKSTVNPYNSELSYITKNDSGGGYFKIPYVPKGRDIKIKIKFTLTSAISSASYLTIFRAYIGEAYEAYRIIRNGASNTSYIFSCGGKASNSRVIDLSLNTVYTIEMTINSVTINNTSYSLYDDVGSENTGQFELMAGYNMSLNYFQVYKANELVVDCVPYRKDMAGAIKERVSDTIIYPTTGTITCGTLTEASESAIYDEIKQDENGIWEAYKRVGDTRATNAISGRGEYDSLEQEEIYILDAQTIPTEITVADQGIEEILPTNGATPTTAPAIMEIQYGSIPSRGLLGGLLGGTKGGGSDEPDYSDGEEIIDYEEEQEPNEDSDEPIVEEPLEEPSDEEPKEDENEEEPKEDIKESPVIDEKQELKK